MKSPHLSVLVARTLPVLFLLAQATVPHGLTARADEPPGARPCLTSGTPNGYGTFLSLRSTLFGQSVGAGAAETSASARLEFQPPSAYAVSNVLVGGTGGFKASLTNLPGGTASWSLESNEANLYRLLPFGPFNTSFVLLFPNAEPFIGFFPFTVISNTPPVPQISNLEAAQSINPASAFRLDWNPWIGAGANDRIHLEIRDPAGLVVFSAASDCSATNLLAPGATGIQIPAGTLRAGASLTAFLTFGATQLRSVDESSLVVLHASHARTTTFPVRTGTGGTTGEPGTLSQPAISGTDLVFLLSGAPSTTYAIESSTGLIVWTKESEVTLPATGRLEVRIKLPTDGIPRFYRATPTGGTGTVVTPGPATLALRSAGPRLLSLTVTGTASGTYRIESAPNYSTWTSVTNVTLPASPAIASLTVEVPMPAGTEFLVYRALGVDSTPAPTLKPGGLSISRDGTRVVVTLTGATPSRAYFFQEHTADWSASTWRTSGFIMTTDATGSATGNFPVPATGSSAVFYRVFAR